MINDDIQDDMDVDMDDDMNDDDMDSDGNIIWVMILRIIMLILIHLCK